MIGFIPKPEFFSDFEKYIPKWEFFLQSRTACGILDPSD